MHERNRERDPVQMAGFLIVQLSELCDETEYIGGGEAFIRDYLDPMYNDEDLDADELAAGFHSGAPVDLAIIVAAAYCVHAIRAGKSGDLMGGWSYVQDASMWFGGACAEVRISRGYDAFSKLRAKRAAEARHAENYEIRDRIHEWWKSNHGNYKSMDKAAEALIRVEPVAFRTARKHIGEAARIYALPAGRKASG